MARRLFLAISVVAAAALVTGVAAAGGLRAAPLPAPRKLKTPLDLGRYRVVVNDALLHQEPGGPVTLDITLRVTNEDRISVLSQDLAVNALALDTAGGPSVTPLSATAYSQGVDVTLLSPGVSMKVVLSYGLPSRDVPPGFHARLVFWGYDHREDFFYGHTQWKPRKPTDAKNRDPAELAVALPIRREGL